MISEMVATRFRRWILCGGGLIVVLIVVCLAGCETGGGTESLNVTPGSATLTGTNDTVLLTVSESSLRELSLPLEWRVANPSNGSIVGAAGLNATYARTGHDGVNVVVVRDQYGAEASVSIEQH